MWLDDLLGEAAESIRIHHASGHFTRVEARARLMGALGIGGDEADAILDRPIDPALFDEYRTWPKGGA